jgi:hypothetical protein
MTDYSACAEDRAHNLALNFKKSLDDEAPGQTAPLPNYAEMIRGAAAEKKKRRERNRQRIHRARPKETSITKLASTLRKAIAKPRGNKQLEQLRGRESELASFRYFSRILLARHGPMSDAVLARLLTLNLDDGFTRKKTWQLGQIVAALEAEGGPWHNI